MCNEMLHSGLIRSALFVPGNRPERIDKAMTLNADIVIIDLEDAVPPPEKSAARQTVVGRLHAIGSCRAFVRVNGMDTPFFQQDIDAVLNRGLSGLMVPKIETRDSLLKLHGILREIEVQKNLATFPVLATIESAKGVANVHDIAQAAGDPPRLSTLVFGAADFTSDLGVEMSKDGQELAYPRARIAIACRAAGLLPPIDTPYMLDLKDLTALEADALKAKNLGYGGKICLHPNQIEIVNRAFNPRPEEIIQAEAVVKAFEEARTKGLGAIQLEGKFIDKPIADRARQILLRTGLRKDDI